ncbi:deoxyribose-phosphate aldolase [Rasiella rasia]|uniref:Deoxyribose-phosphate aldolase n=1 Tax=Rasiella rasia TaxID=2744027 RepID=A0A6G6GJZ3_9FLAO|nr:DUF6503 family protein [Rasiella rasia]QIE58895.1 deoxyribose-phosphate aldolase [Rasiella rasia]
MKPISIIFLVLLMASCQQKEALSADTIINKAIEQSCNGKCDTVTIDFDFRGIAYKSSRSKGMFYMDRTFTDSLGIVRDVISNEGFQRFINDSLIAVVDSTAQKYAESVNSVHYFAQLPYGLNAPAAQKELLGETVIKGEPYYEIGVTFLEEGGGTDFEDRFVYWVHKKHFLVDYLAYSYAVNGGGIRFREAYNPRNVNGIRFVDYKNYKPKGLGIPLISLAKMFENNELELLSKIETENVQVSTSTKN